MSDDTRQRDIEIARALGYEVTISPTGYAFMWSGGGTVPVPAYSTDLRDCAGLQVDVMKRGWKFEGDWIATWNSETGHSEFYSATFSKDEFDLITRGSLLTDPEPAFCDATSQACLEALKADAGRDAGAKL